MNNSKKTVLIADENSEFFASLDSVYLCIKVVHSDELLASIKDSKPDLIILDLHLPGLHGIDLLKQIKDIPIVITSHPIEQNRTIAMENGAIGFFPKPFSSIDLLSLCADFFAGKALLSPSFQPHYPSSPKKAKGSYIKFWGTRGSVPVSGEKYTRYGGNTNCLEIRSGDELVIFDAGTGIRELGEELKKEGFKKIHLFLSHTHLDHITGLPFFHPLYDPEVDITIWTPSGYEKSGEEVIKTLCSYPFFPLRLGDMQATISFKTMGSKERITIGETVVETHAVCHPGATIGFKISVFGKKIGYVTDHEALLKCEEKEYPLFYKGIIDFFKGLDLMIHEAQYEDTVYLRREGWGHSSVSHAERLMAYIKPKKWIVTHHDPIFNDDALDEKLKKARQQEVDVDFAYDHLQIYF